MNGKIKELVEKAIEDYMPYYSKKEDGLYHDEIYADYRDEMSDDTAIEILTAKCPQEVFDETMFEWYRECEWEIIDHVKEAVFEYLEENAEDEQYDEVEVVEFIQERVVVDYPYDHYLKQEFYVNIMVDTGDGNHDYVLNCVYPHYNGVYGETIDDKASIAWLAKQQGYTKTELTRALREGDISAPEGFLQSMRQEVINMGSHMATLTFLVRMTLEDLMELNRLIELQDRNGKFYCAKKRPYCGYIIIDKKAETGLYDPWGGGGSVFEVQLEKDVRLPIRFIRSALPDGGDGHSIESVYGMSGSVWRSDVVKKIHCPKEFRKEMP